MEKLMRRFILLTGFVFTVVTNASAQFAIVDQMGQPFLTKNYTDIKGSAYLYDKWMKGSLTTANGTTYEGVELMYDQVADELIFKSEKGEPRTSTQPLSEFTIKAASNAEPEQERLFRAGFAPVDGAKPASFYEVLTDGDTQLLKRTSKKIFEELPYGSATKVKAFQAETYYYLAKDGKLTKIRNDRKAVLKALSAQESKLEEYIKKNRLDLKKDADLAKVIVYYNSLKD